METFQRQFRQQQQDIRDAAESEDKDSYVPPSFPGARGGYSVHHGIIVCVPDKRPDANPLCAAVLGGRHTVDAIKKAQNYSSLHMTSHSIGVVRTRRIYPRFNAAQHCKREQVHLRTPTSRCFRMNVCHKCVLLETIVWLNYLKRNMQTAMKK